MHSKLACLALLSVALCSVALAAEKYDYIVVGTGPGGAPVARRLAEAGKKVLVLERGANISDLDNVYLRPPRYYDGSIYNDWFVKRYTQERYPNINQNQPYTTQSGGAYGGSTTVNGQIAIRGDRKSYDEWATEFGLLNWGYFGLLPYLIKAENNSRYNASDPSQRFSNEGPVPIITEIETGDYNNLYLQSVAASPIHSLASNPYISSSSDIRGAGWVDKTMSSKRARTFASENYIDPVLDLDITVYTNAIVTKLISSKSGSSVKGVIVLIEGETQEFKLKNDGEVILAAGPFETPKILMLSGYGPLDQLYAHGIPVKKEVDGVGKNFQDHPGFAFVNLGNVTEPQNTISYPPPQALVDEWKVNASGLLARSSDPITAFYSSGINGDEVDVQISFAESVPLALLPYPNAFLILCYNVKPKSRGRLTLRNANPISDPVIEMGYLSNDTDIKVLVECVKYAHQLSTDKQNSPLAQFVVGNVLPGLPENLWQLPPSILDPILEQVIHIAMQQGYHFGGSTSMGSVLTEDLTIQGVSGLRVVGVAAQPKVVGFNPQMSVYGMSEKLADLIKKDIWYKHRNSRYPNSLTISSLCGGRWSVSNPNNKEAVFDWEAKDSLTNQPLYQGAFSVPANSNVIIYTDEEPLQVQVSVYLYGNLQATANNASC